MLRTIIFLVLLFGGALGALGEETSSDARLKVVEEALEAGERERADSLADSLAAALDGDDLATASTLQALGELDSKEEIGDALAAFERALDIRTRQLGPGHEDSVESAVAAAQELLWLSRADEAAEILARTEEAARAEHDPDSEVFLLLEDRLGQVADHRSDYAQARRHYERALELSRLHGQEKTRPAGVFHYRIARLDYILGNNPGALEGYSRALEIFEEALGPEDNTVGQTLIDRAAVLSDMKDFDGSLEDLDRARVILEANLPANHPNLGALYHRYGETEMRRDDLDAALPWLEKALAIREEAHGPDHPNVAATLSKLAQLHRRQGHPELAIPILERKLAIYEKSHGREHPWYAATLFSMSLNHTDLNQYDLALDEALEAERIQRNQLRRETREMTERTGLMYAADRSEGAGLKVGLSLATKNLSQEQLRRVWDALIDARSFVLDELAYRRRALGGLDDDTVAGLWRELAEASSELARVTAQSDDATDPEVVAARERHDRAERRLAEIDETLAHPRRADRVALADVEGALPEKSALVGFARNETYFTYSFEYVAMVRAPGGRLTCVQLGDADEIDALVAQWREQARGEGLAGDPAAAEARYREAGAALREVIWDPVAAQLADAELALIVPDGQLALVNFAALPREAGGYLVENDVVLHLLGTERDAVEYEQPLESQGDLLALGAPAFDAAVGELALSSTPSGGGILDEHVESSSFRGARSGCGDFRSTRFDPLPGSASEVEAIVARWPGHPTVLTGSDANEAALKALAPRSRVLHLATHGFFLAADCSVDETPEDSRGVGGMAPTAESPRVASPDENLLSLSGLALAGANTRNQASRDVEDGVLTAEEVAALDLSRLQWAVLSACDSGVGDVHVAEGVLGLRRAFRAAGARTLILSLWSVDDLATRDWMEGLYAARFTAGESTAQAVRDAARSQLTARRERGETTHPFYWGGFIGTGDWH